jgi:class 3 adenylate cyclase
MEYTALGHVVNLASRLCGAAKAGEILTTPFTRDAALRNIPAGAVPGFLSFLSKGKMRFKNIQETVEVISIATEETKL